MCRKLVYLLSCFLMLSLALADVTLAADPSLIGYWPFDEESGDTAFDFSGYGNDGALSGDLTWQSGGGHRDGALLWGGENSAHVEISASEISPSAGSVMMWGYLSEPQPAQTRYFFGHTTQAAYDNRIQLYMDGTNTELDLGLGGAHAVTTNMIVLETARWYHVALTYDGGSYVVYIDGEVISSGSYSGLTAIHDFAWIGNDGNPITEGTEGFGGLLDEVALYNRALTQEEVLYVMNGGLGTVATATEPNPEDGAVDVHQDAVLSWIPGKFPGTHDVYFGTVLEDVDNADRSNPMDILVSQGQADATYGPAGLLDLGQVYYWRIDEVNASPDGTIYKGDVWSFTAEPVAYPIEGVTASDSISAAAGDAQNTVNGSGLNENDEHSVEATDMWLAIPAADPLSIQFEFDRAYKLHEMWVWNYNVQFELVLGFGLKDVTIEYSLDGVDWMVLGDAVFAQATASASYTHNTTADLGGVLAKFIRVTVNSGYGVMGQFGLSEVRFFQIPVAAREPQPADGETGVNPNALLSWRAGRGAVSHDVSFGADADALAVVDTVTDSSYDPGALDLGMTYYWKIDEINEAAAPAKAEGDVWSFSTQEYFVVDDFESYNDDENRIYDAWLDGFGNDTGSTVGYFEAPFAETTTVHGGGQSMPLEYANDTTPFYSEAERDLGSADWTANGADTLKLFVFGQAPAFLETAEGDIFMNAIGNDIWGNADQFRYVSKNLTGDGSITARVDALDGTPNGWVKGGVMIRQSTDAGAINTFMAMTGGDGGGATFQQRMTADGSSVSQHTYADGPFAPPYWVRVTREGNTFTAFTSPDGETWTERGDTITLAMADPVLIGLALTSHNSNQATSAAFSNISTTGNVGGQWTVADIGVAQPVGGNSPEDMYVAVEDTSGNVAVVSSPNATARPGWTEWVIPFGDLNGVNLSRVAMMYIGVGDRDNPSAGGTGLVFIDDILVGHDVSAE